MIPALCVPAGSRSDAAAHPPHPHNYLRNRVEDELVVLVSLRRKGAKLLQQQRLAGGLGAPGG